MTDIADRYVALWRETDPEARRAAIASVWVPDGVEYVEGTQFRGHAELEKRVAEANQQFVVERGLSIVAVDDRERHGDIITGTVQMVDTDLEVVWSARIFLILNDDGQIVQDYQLTVQPLTP
jgi:hypothetical protein